MAVMCKYDSRYHQIHSKNNHVIISDSEAESILSMYSLSTDIVEPCWTADSAADMKQ